jgi:hypothetical protein
VLWRAANVNQRALVGGRGRQVPALDDARSVVSIEGDIVEGLQRKPRQDRAVCSDRNTIDPPDELDTIALSELVVWLCHTP